MMLVETTELFPIVTMKHRQTLSLQNLLSSGRPLVVGTLHDAIGMKFLKSATPARLRGLDVLEARLDSIGYRSVKFPASWPLPVIATARHPDEGGAGNLSAAIRRGFLEEAMPWASALDIELRSARALSSVIACAHQHGRTVILSHHDFSATPTTAVLKKLAARAGDEGADLFKVATLLRTPSDLLRLVEFQSTAARIPVAAMGMGSAGRFSRIVLCGFGAPLCYGWLGSPQVPGQWPALSLAGLLKEILPA
jgi:3-dehydroquinate dehydratase-1